MPPELRDLMQRYCALGRLLPPPDDLPSADDPRALAEVAVVLEEMHAVRAEIDAFLDAAKARRN